MISQHCFTPEWINKQRNELGGADPVILEKSIHALALVCQLRKYGLPFVFKGGTSLLLHLNPIRRLSIDADIVTKTFGDELNDALEHVASEKPFIKFEEDEREHRGLPHRRHFKFYYTAIDKANPAPYILLDAVEEPDFNLATEERPVKVAFLETDDDISITLPTAAALLGDKLAAFAPHTIGVPFETHRGVSQTMQVAKQMFDVGELLTVVENVSDVAAAYRASYELEIRYLGGGYSIADCLRDTIQTSFHICAHGLRGVKENETAMKVRDGVSRLRGHLIRDAFRPDIEAKTAAARAAFLAAAILSGKSDLSMADYRYDPARVNELRGIRFEGEYAPLSRLAGQSAEALHYWNHIQAFLAE